MSARLTFAEVADTEGVADPADAQRHGRHGRPGRRRRARRCHRSGRGLAEADVPEVATLESATFEPATFRSPRARARGAPDGASRPGRSNAPPAAPQLDLGRAPSSARPRPRTKREPAKREPAKREPAKRGSAGEAPPARSSTPDDGPAQRDGLAHRVHPCRRQEPGFRVGRRAKPGKAAGPKGRGPLVRVVPGTAPCSSKPPPTSSRSCPAAATGPRCLKAHPRGRVIYLTEADRGLFPTGGAPPDRRRGALSPGNERAGSSSRPLPGRRRNAPHGSSRRSSRGDGGRCPGALHDHG